MIFFVLKLIFLNMTSNHDRSFLDKLLGIHKKKVPKTPKLTNDNKTASIDSFTSNRINLSSNESFIPNQSNIDIKINDNLFENSTKSDKSKINSASNSYQLKPSNLKLNQLDLPNLDVKDLSKKFKIN